MQPDFESSIFIHHMKSNRYLVNRLFLIIHRSKSNAFCSTDCSLGILVDVATEGEYGLNGFNQIVDGCASIFPITCELRSKARFMCNENINFPDMRFKQINLALAKVT